MGSGFHGLDLALGEEATVEIWSLEAKDVAERDHFVRSLGLKSVPLRLQRCS